jgi:hypothetical protein
LNGRKGGLAKLHQRLVRKKSEIWPKKAALGRHLGPQKATIGQGSSPGLQIFAQIPTKNEIFACLALGTVNTAYVQGFFETFLIFSVTSVAGSNL